MGFSSSSSIRGDGTSGSTTYKQFYKTQSVKLQVLGVVRFPPAPLSKPDF